MAAEVGRDVADPQAAVGGAVVGMGPDAFCQRRGVAPLPLAVLLVKRSSVMLGAKEMGIEQVAVDFRRSGFQLHGEAIAGDRFLQPSLVSQGSAQVVMRRDIARPEF